jgi:hypothetical protein
MPQSLFKYYIIYKAIVRHNSETIVNVELKSSCKYHCRYNFLNLDCLFVYIGRNSSDFANTICRHICGIDRIPFKKVLISTNENKQEI